MIETIFFLFFMYVTLYVIFVKKRNSDVLLTVFKWVFIIGIVSFVLMEAGDSVNSSKTREEYVAKADGFTIEKYDVNLNVSSKDVVSVLENIDVNFFESGHHGIYKFVPRWLEYTSKNNETISRKSVVSNLKSTDEYSLDEVKGKDRIRIGSPYSTLDVGIKSYNITYDYDMGSDPYKGYDEFIFHVFGDYWGTKLNNASIKVNMPKNIEGNKVHFFMDKKRKYDVTNAVDYSINGNVLEAKFNEEKYNDLIKNKSNYPQELIKSLTVDIELPEGYFEKGTYNYGFMSLTFILTNILIAVVSIICWIIFGKDHEKKEKLVQFLPPEGFSSAEVGYIYKKKTGKKLTISLIITLAMKKVIEIKDEKSIRIINLYPIVEKEIKYPRRITINKLKEVPDNYSEESKEWFNKLFEKSKKVILTDNFDDYEKYCSEFLQDKIIKVNVEIDVKEENKNYDKVMKEREEKLSSLNEYERVVYDALFEYGDDVVLKEHPTFYQTFSTIDSKLKSNLQWNIKDKTGENLKRVFIFFSVLMFFFEYISYVYIKDLDPQFKFLYAISMGSVVVTLFFGLIMDRKTEYGEKMHSYVCGFKEFLETVEKEKLEELVEEMPEYFYMILPYTYVFDISKKWIEKFEDIKIPDTNLSVYSSYDFDSIIDNVSYPVYSSSSSGGCSSCGGGCSSCGGGCSSCGGGGSW